MGWEQGTVVVDSGEVIARPGMLLSDLQETPLGASARVEGDEDSIYKRLVLDAVVIEGYECAVAEYYTRDVLTLLDIVLTEATSKRLSFVGGYASPPDGPEVRFLRKWVQRETGRTPPSRFSWGAIGNTYDTKGNFPCIPFRYYASKEGFWSRFRAALFGKQSRMDIG